MQELLVLMQGRNSHSFCIYNIKSPICAHTTGRLSGAREEENKEVLNTLLFLRLYSQVGLGLTTKTPDAQLNPNFRGTTIISLKSKLNRAPWVFMCYIWKPRAGRWADSAGRTGHGAQQSHPSSPFSFLPWWGRHQRVCEQRWSDRGALPSALVSEGRPLLWGPAHFCKLSL